MATILLLQALLDEAIYDLLWKIEKILGEPPHIGYCTHQRRHSFCQKEDYLQKCNGKTKKWSTQNHN